MATFKIQIQMMDNEWKSAAKIMTYEGGKWVEPTFESYEAAEEALESAYDMDQYADCSRIVRVKDEGPVRFKEGKTYSTRSICDHNCIIEITVLKRTAKTIVADCGWKGEKRLRITEYDGVETVKPWGSYSMAPVINAK